MIDSVPMVICMIEASNAFLSLLPALLAHDLLDLTGHDMDDIGCYYLYECMRAGKKQIDGSRARMQTYIM